MPHISLRQGKIIIAAKPVGIRFGHPIGHYGAPLALVYRAHLILHAPFYFHANECRTVEELFDHSVDRGHTVDGKVEMTVEKWRGNHALKQFVREDTFSPGARLWLGFDDIMTLYLSI